MKKYLIYILLFCICSLEATEVYLLSSQPSKLITYTLDQIFGRLKEELSVSLPGKPMCAVQSRDKQFLYVGIRNSVNKGEKPSGTLMSFSINEDGSPQKMTEINLPYEIRYMVLDKTGQHLFFVDYFNGYAVHLEVKNGAVTGKVISKVQTEVGSHGLQVMPDGRNIFVSQTKQNRVLHIGLGENTGSLKVLGHEAAPGPETENHAPRHIKHHPQLPILYTSNEHKGGISVWKWNAALESLKLLQSETSLPIDFTGKSTAADLHIHPNGKFVYVSNRGGKGAASEKGADTLACYRIDEHSGKVTLIHHTKVSKRPRSFAISTSGKYLIVAGQAGKALEVYRINETSGKLVKTSTTITEGSANWVELRNR